MKVINEDIMQSDCKVAIYADVGESASILKQKYPCTYRNIFTDELELGTLLVVDATPIQKHAVLYVHDDDGTLSLKDALNCLADLDEYLNEIGIDDSDVGIPYSFLHKLTS